MTTLEQELYDLVEQLGYDATLSEEEIEELEEEIQSLEDEIDYIDENKD